MYYNYSFGLFINFFFFTDLKSKFASSKFTSANTGFAPLNKTALAVDVKVYEGIITSSSFLRFIKIIAISSALVQLWVNATNLDFKSVKKKINKKTKAIIVVRYGGNSCNMDKFL